MDKENEVYKMLNKQLKDTFSMFLKKLTCIHLFSTCSWTFYYRLTHGLPYLQEYLDLDSSIKKIASEFKLLRKAEEPISHKR